MGEIGIEFENSLMQVEIVLVVNEFLAPRDTQSLRSSSVTARLGSVAAVRKAWRQQLASHFALASQTEGATAPISLGNTSLSHSDGYYGYIGSAKGGDDGHVQEIG